MANKINSTKADQKIHQAIKALKDLGFPRQQLNERSALTLLSLLDLKPNDPWSNAHDPLMGITPMMKYFADHYGKRYAPNTRETVRRQTIHQFVQAALVVPNPDKPSRPTNSPQAVYQIDSSALKLLREFGSIKWIELLKEYLSETGTLQKLYAKERDMHRIPATLHSGVIIQLSPGRHNILVKKIIHVFCPLFTPACKIIYVGDTQKKWAYFDSEALRELGVEIEEHGKMPDVVVHYTGKNWLVLIESVTSHGPVNPKRRQELKALFANSTAGLVYVTAFLDRHTMTRHLNEISWETEVWVADAPTHLIHFNGERFLGPHD